jgi:hypothetical protein
MKNKREYIVPSLAVVQLKLYGCTLAVASGLDAVSEGKMEVRFTEEEYDGEFH